MEEHKEEEMDYDHEKEEFAWERRILDDCDDDEISQANSDGGIFPDQA